MDLITDLTNISVSIILKDQYEPLFNELLSFIESCNNSNYKSYIFSDTNIDFRKQNNDVVSENNMNISISDQNTIFLPNILDLKHNENLFQNLKRNMNDNNIKSLKTAIEKEKGNNVFLSQTADMAAIEFNQTFFINFEKIFLYKKNKDKNARKLP